jgi:hypothetical protein
LKSPLTFAASALLLAAAAFGQPAPKPVLYNNLDGDGGVELDRAIKTAYTQKYNVVDTSRSAGFTEPRATAGELPRYVRDKQGQMLVGYCLVAYVISADGQVLDPVMVRWTDERVCRVALEAMADWRFTPGMLKGIAVASTAAQEFNFGAADASNGYKMARLVVYQPHDVIVRRMPPGENINVYVERLRLVTHNFFVGSTTPETLSIVVINKPGLRSRVWFVSSLRPGNAGGLEPLRKLLEAVPPMDVHGGPVILGLTGLVAGGDGLDMPEGENYRNPVPAEWRDAAAKVGSPPTFASDAYVELVWPEAR